MARPRRETKQLFYDTFADFEVADQAIVLDMLGEIHRQKKRLARKPENVAGSANSINHSQGSLLDGPATETGNGGSKEKKS